LSWLSVVFLAPFLDWQIPTAVGASTGGSTTKDSTHFLNNLIDWDTR
jgi:hypothetical protein